MDRARTISMTSDTPAIPGVNKALAAAVLALAGLATSTACAQAGRAPAARDLGKTEYDMNCASCHGPAGRGDGPLRPYLSRPSADLTVLARANGGVLPVSRLYSAIEGTAEASAHGTRDMPVWGNEYRMRAGEHYVDVPYDPEGFVRARILALIDYVARLQVR